MGLCEEDQKFQSSFFKECRNPLAGQLNRVHITFQLKRQCTKLTLTNKHNIKKTTERKSACCRFGKGTKEKLQHIPKMPFSLVRTETTDISLSVGTGRNLMIECVQRSDYNFNSLAILDAMFLKAMLVPDILCKSI